MNRTIRNLVASLFLSAPVAASAADAPKINFQDHILPLFRNSCLNCHNPDKKKGGLDLTTYGATMAGSDANKVINAGDPDGSLLYKLVTHADEPKMPQKADKLPAKDLDLIKQWIAGGALETATGKPATPNKPKVDLSVVVSSGKPSGIIAFPKNVPTDPIVHTKRPAPAQSIAASPWAPLVAIAGQKEIILYNTDTLELLGILPFPSGFPQVLSFSRNGNILIAGGGIGAKLGRVVLYDVSTGKQMTEVGDEYDAILAADISPDQSRVALGGPSKMLRVVATADGHVIESVKKHTDWVTAVAYSPDGKYLASGDRNGGLVVWDPSVREVYFLTGHKGAITSLSFRDDSKLLASSSEDGTVKLWNMDGGTMLKSVNTNSGGTLSMAFTHDGRFVTTGRDRAARLFAADGASLKSCDPFLDIALRCAFNHDGSRVIAGDFSGVIRVYSAETGKEIGELSSNPVAPKDRLTDAQQRLAEVQAEKQRLVESLPLLEEAAKKAATQLEKSKGMNPRLLDPIQAAATAANDKVAKTKLAIAQADTQIAFITAEIQKFK